MSIGTTRTLLFLAGLSLAAMAQSQAAPAGTPSSPPAATAAAALPATLEGVFDAARRGDISPLRHALQSAPAGDLRSLYRARLRAAALDPAAGRDPVLARLASGRDPALRRAALEVLAAASFANGDFAAAMRHGRALSDAVADAGRRDEAEEFARMWRLAALLAGQPGQRLPRAVAAGTTAARIDRVGLPRIDMNVNGQAVEAVFDTGANLSVLSAETARRLGVTALDGEVAIGNGVDTTVPSRVGIARRIEVAGNVVENVPVLIIDDSHLSFPQVPGGYEIDAILGMPVMRALGRLRMERGGRLLVLPPPGSGASNMHASGNLLYVDTAVADAPVPLLLDTGAGQTELSSLYAAGHGEAIAALPRARTGRGGAGGARIVEVANWASAPIAIAGRRLTLPQLPVRLPTEGDRPARDFGTIGASVLRAFESYTLDFRAMRFELGEPIRSAGSGS